MENQAKNIAFKILKYLAPFGDKAGRYIYIDSCRNDLIYDAAQKLEIEVTDDLRSPLSGIVYRLLKSNEKMYGKILWSCN
ncbi:hypothetical protein [Brunnivagina elsteri]|uniref:Uncharacterized protein n=1 Tax=Brunnivagina elsteri CCALA 953 TaxID=987040 RepID=A0A2A2TMX3_9CYAN|nr:hypothetical protein [Calothrix elsteri]PAX59800.1 hypothetical protein CK510_05335 [Calothrix elsteri CCALA 953]